MKFGLILAALSLAAGSAWADSDTLARKHLSYTATNPDEIVVEVASHVKDIFDRYQIATDSSTTIVSPLQVGGTEANPVIKATLKKCVTFICATVDFDAEISVTKVKGRCDQNFMLLADLSRSGDLLRGIYDNFNVAICYKKTNRGATLDLDAQAHIVPGGKNNVLKGQVFSLLQLQIDPLVKAINETLLADGAH